MHGDETKYIQIFKRAQYNCVAQRNRTHTSQQFPVQYLQSLFAGDRSTRGPSSNRCSTLKQRILTEVSVLENQRLQLQFLFKSQRIVQCQLHGHVGLSQSLWLMETMTFICGRKLRRENLHNDYIQRVRRGHYVRLQV